MKTFQAFWAVGIGGALALAALAGGPAAAFAVPAAVGDEIPLGHTQPVDAPRGAPVCRADSIYTPVGTPAESEVIAIDGAGQPMTTGITITSQLPAGVTWDPATRIIRVDGTVDVPLTVIRIMVTDQGLVDLCEMTVATYRLPAPTITLTDARVEVFVGEQVAMQLLVDAKGRDPFPVTIPALPDWLTWDKQTNLISGQAPRVGEFQFDVFGDGVKYASGTVIVKAKPGAAPSPRPSGGATAPPTPAPQPSVTAIPTSAPQPSPTTIPTSTPQPSASATAPQPATPGPTSAPPPRATPAAPGGQLARTGANAPLLAGGALAASLLGAGLLRLRRRQGH
ncbi:hypothetical protein [Buchananella hordeovulneris]|uniref:hypothetical protein n=1 Tax=Buchananella hordeovulneris TaxID=52770 RepID=UPI000F5D7A9B|nr:hypothetical protein [Buchananella hordeovulneris]MDO5080195.1 hypothetical protein [Buchananella hordeovulneris]RRD52213.1 hypothetical protein EII12_05575 [Buchananella hordeovulneris]